MRSQPTRETPGGKLAGTAPVTTQANVWNVACPGKSAASEAITEAKEIVTHAAQQMRAGFGEDLTREESLKLISAFRAGVVQKRRPGRRRKKQIKGAYADWKGGMRDVQLFEKHIRGRCRHNRYHGLGEQKILMDAIRSR